MFSSKIAFIQLLYLSNKISIYANDPYNLPLKPHVAVRIFSERRYVEYVMYTWK